MTHKKLSPELEKQADKIFNDSIYPSLIRSKQPQDSPVGYVLGGQPGAGKSSLTKMIKDMVDFHENVVVIDLDSFRKYHPEASALYEKYGTDAARFNHEFAAYISEKAVDRATSEGYNVIIEGTFRTAGKPIHDISLLEERGYITGVAIIATPAEISKKGLTDRKQEEEKAGLQARLTPLPHHDLVVDKLAENANIVFREKPTDKFFVFTRNGLIYDKNIHRGEPGEYINRELNKFNDNVLSSERSKEMDKARDSYNKITKIENIDLKFIHEAENKLQEKRDSLIQEQRKSKIQANINTKNKNKQADLEP